MQRKTFKLDDIDKHLKTHIEHLIFNKTMNSQGGKPIGVLGMLMAKKDVTPPHRLGSDSANTAPDDIDG
jgi:hypothetical protein